MTNYEMIISLDADELAWVLMNNCTRGGERGCDLCVWKEWSSEECGGEDRSCIQGHREFLKREMTPEDEVIYAVAHNNVVVDIYNNMSDGERSQYRIEYREVNGKKYANVLVPVSDDEKPFSEVK